jgi:hypothetical protein
MQIGKPTDVKHVAHIGWDNASVTAPSWVAASVPVPPPTTPFPCSAPRPNVRTPTNSCGWACHVLQMDEFKASPGTARGSDPEPSQPGGSEGCGEEQAGGGEDGGGKAERPRRARGNKGSGGNEPAKRRDCAAEGLRRDRRVAKAADAAEGAEGQGDAAAAAPKQRRRKPRAASGGRSKSSSGGAAASDSAGAPPDEDDRCGC